MILAEHEPNMRKALLQAKQAKCADEVPVGVIIVKQGHILGQAHNQVELLKDPTAHAEMIAITQAAFAMQDWRLTETVMYVTKEPCPMCAGAIMLARIPLVIWGVDDPHRGGARSLFNILQNDALNHRTEIISGILEEDCRQLLQNFFREKRKQTS